MHSIRSPRVIRSISAAIPHPHRAKTSNVGVSVLFREDEDEDELQEYEHNYEDKETDRQDFYAVAETETGLSLSNQQKLAFVGGHVRNDFDMFDMFDLI